MLHGCRDEYAQGLASGGFIPSAREVFGTAFPGHCVKKDSEEKGSQRTSIGLPDERRSGTCAACLQTLVGQNPPCEIRATLSSALSAPRCIQSSRHDYPHFTEKPSLGPGHTDSTKLGSEFRWDHAHSLVGRCPPAGQFTPPWRDGSPRCRFPPSCCFHCSPGRTGWLPSDLALSWPALHSSLPATDFTSTTFSKLMLCPEG